MELIKDKVLLKLNMHILATGYLKKGAFYFTELTGDNEKTNENGEAAEMVFDLEKETKKKDFI